ncbi:hypothetical protein PTSG_12363 [Salpingoeca rosetta]|uniref:Kinesin-like protein n=1 Tax=Salpingoeca rosetta (strain ATCC 50818 / BSB-021) TaxID=946362 RepID=F2UCU8_SALR5|nr:uncharacterized protein PTSG_12363 [Salpingoeca rosetta]EGD74443.1 hypothetical protein PTSG_12363 [Salpingoeca rosetta]|eukprot:XP_004992700.1 hypothetical protein PTSG_12363 [Salpingoeca rosetta]
MSSGGNVRVVCRFRPQLSNETSRGGVNISTVDPSGSTVSIDGQRQAQFTFDRVFDGDSSQDDVYEYAARPIVEDVLKGYNGTIFAYGQTSSGKTHTMEGPSIDDPASRGIIPRIVENIFQYIDMAPETLEFTVRVSYFEIYMERISDLLCDGNDNLQIHENRERGVYVRHATELYMQDPEDVMDVMRAGAERRSVASTNMNDISSRSHSVFLMEISQKDTVRGGMKTGKLFLVDLAGSEKVSKTHAEGEVLQEAKNINKSLSALGLVIMSLTDGQKRQHVPYRDSKLTRILQESLGGNSRTTIIICCSPSSYNEQETISTLRFGQRAKRIKNRAVINVKYSAEELQKQLDQAKKEIKKLAKRLQAAEAELKIWREGGTVSEADRVALTAQAGDAVTKALAEGEEEEEEGAGPKEAGGISEEERRELLEREEELLNLLDDKDKFIRELEREIEVLSQDKVTITKLASEKAQLQQLLQEQEEVETNLLAENEEYESAIEDMAMVNGKLDADLKAAIERTKKLQGAMEEQTAATAAQLASVAEAVARLSSAEDAEAELPETGTIVDTQLSKVHAYVKQLLSKGGDLEKVQSEMGEEKTKLQEALEATRRELTTSQVSYGQLEKKHADLLQAKEKLAQEAEELRQHKAESQARIEGLMSQLVTIEENVQQKEAQARSTDEKRMTELREELEKQRSLQREEDSKELAALRSDLETTKAALEKNQADKDELLLEVEQLKSDLEAQRHVVDAQKTELAQLSERAAASEKEKKESEVIGVATRQKLHSYTAMSEKWRETILEQCRTALNHLRESGAIAGTAGGAGEEGAGSAEQQVLHKENERLRREAKDLATKSRTLQRQLHVSDTRIKAYEKRIVELEAKMEENARKMRRRVREAVKAQSGAEARAVRRKHPPVQSVRGGSRLNMDDSKAQFWANEAKQSRMRDSRVLRSERSSSILGQGEPLVGQFKEKTKNIDMEKELNTVQYV